MRRQDFRNPQEAEMSSVGYHEPGEDMSDETRDMHRYQEASDARMSAK